MKNASMGILANRKSMTASWPNRAELLCAAGTATVFALLLTTNSVNAENTCLGAAEGRVCQAQQRAFADRPQIVNGDGVDIATQKSLGLVTVGIGCSGTLVNRSWVLTADHCVTTDGNLGGPNNSFSNLVITAAWTSLTATPTRSIRNWNSRGLDVALLFLGGTDLGPVNFQRFYDGQVSTAQIITKYGRGRYAFAQAGPPPVPAPQSDNKYRSAQFIPAGTGANFITIQPNLGGPSPSFGDSGGPDIVTAPLGTNLGIAGVQSTCVWNYVAGQPQTIDWVERMISCTSAGLAGIRQEILSIITEHLVWHNDTTGETKIWFINDSSRVGSATVLDEHNSPILVGSPWRIVGRCDFDGGGPDLLWYNDRTGELQIWSMDGYRIRRRLTVTDFYGIPMLVGPPWRVVGASNAEWTGDGAPHIWWHNDLTGETKYWRVDGSTYAYAHTVTDLNGTALLVGSPWSIVSIDDLNGDGKADIIWHNASSGETKIWYMNGWLVTGQKTLFWENHTAPALVGMPWHITGSNDFDKDNIADLIWHNDVTGETKIWYMTLWYDDPTIKSQVTVNATDGGGSAMVGAPWAIVPQ